MGGFPDDLHDRIDIGQDVVIPETQDLVAAKFKKPGSLRVIGFLLAVLTTIGLHHQACLPR